MSRLPRQVKANELARIVVKLGFELKRQKGSDAIYKQAVDGRLVVIPMHAKPLKMGTLHGIVRDLGITVEEFVELL